MFNRLLQTEDDVLAAARHTGEEAGMPAIEVSAQHGKLLFLLATAIRASRVLEIGTLAGYSTINLARAVGADGRVVTLEYEPRHAEVARKNLVRAGVGDRVEVIVGAALDSLPQLAAADKTFDLIFIDADKAGYLEYLNTVLELGLLAPHGLICVDNTLMQGQPWTAGEPTANGVAIHAFNRAVAADPRVEQVIVPLRDGLTLIRPV